MKIKISSKMKHNLHPGLNPAVDIAVFKKKDDRYQILLITRGKNSFFESGKKALPGGFHDTYQNLKDEWKEDKETSKEAAVRELMEETGLNVLDLFEEIKYVKEYDGIFDKNSKSYVRTQLFTLLLPENFNSSVQGSDDAQDAGWYDIYEAININLAFDHKQKILDSLLKLGLE